MATIVRLKNPKHLGMFTKEFFVVRRETCAYTLSNGKLVISKKLPAGTKITLVECTAVYSDNSEKMINQMSSGEKKLDCALLGKMSYTSIGVGDVPILVDSADIFWEDDINGKFDSAYRIPSSTPTTTNTTASNNGNTQNSQNSQYEPTSMPEFDKEAYVAYANGDAVNVRDNPSTASSVKILGKLNTGDSISVSNYNNSPPGEWTRVIYKGVPAFVSSKYLSKTKPKTTTSSTSSNNSSSNTKIQQASNQSLMEAEDSFFTPVVVISGIAAMALLAWSLMPSKPKTPGITPERKGQK